MDNFMHIFRALEAHRKMIECSDLTDFAAFLDSLSHEDRKNAIYELKKKTKFCWECGWDFDPNSSYLAGYRVCHCTNDV